MTSSLTSAEYVESFRRDRSAAGTDQGCHLGHGALARHREAEQYQEKQEKCEYYHAKHPASDVVIRQLNRSVPLPCSANPSYPFSQPPFHYPHRPGPKSESANVCGRLRGGKGVLVGSLAQEDAREKAFREHRSGEQEGEEQGPAKSLSPLRALLPAEMQGLKEAEQEQQQQSECEWAALTVPSDRFLPPHRELPLLTELEKEKLAAQKEREAIQEQLCHMSMGLRQLKEEEMERHRVKTQADVGSPLDWPSMPTMAPIQQAGIDRHDKFPPSMHDRRYYHDAALWNPFRTPRLADMWGGLDFSFRFLQQPELRPRIGGVVGGERGLQCSMGGATDRHDPYRRVGYNALYGPALASYCPENTVTPLLEGLNDQIFQLTRKEREAAEEEAKWREIYCRARERRPPEDCSPSRRNRSSSSRSAAAAAAAGLVARSSAPLSTGRAAIDALLAHQEEKEGGRELFQTAQDEAAEAMERARSNPFFHLPFPAASQVVNLNLLKAKRAQEKLAAKQLGKSEEKIEREKIQEEEAEERERQLSLEAEARAGVFITRRPPTPIEDWLEEPYQPDGFGEKKVFMHTDQVHLQRLKLRRAALEKSERAGFPRTSRRVYALPPMADSDFVSVATALRQRRDAKKKGNREEAKEENGSEKKGMAPTTRSVSLSVDDEIERTATAAERYDATDVSAGAGDAGFVIPTGSSSALPNLSGPDHRRIDNNFLVFMAPPPRYVPATQDAERCKV